MDIFTCLRDKLEIIYKKKSGIDYPKKGSSPFIRGNLQDLLLAVENLAGISNKKEIELFAIPEEFRDRLERLHMALTGIIAPRTLAVPEGYIQILTSIEENLEET